jgi:hypothetical protein
MNISYWNFGVVANPTNTLDTPDGARSIALSGVTGSFDALRIKLSGGSTYPSVDEVRIGSRPIDVTYGVPEPASIVLLGTLATLAIGMRAWFVARSTSEIEFRRSLTAFGDRTTLYNDATVARRNRGVLC